MAIAAITYAYLGTASFSVDAATAKTLNSTAASGSTLTALRTAVKDLAMNDIKAFISCPGGDIRFSLGATPTSSTYHKLSAGSTLTLDVELSAFSFISAAGTQTVYVDYYGS